MKAHQKLQLLSLIFLSALYSCSNTKPAPLNHKASITNFGDLEENPLLLHAITTAVDFEKNQMSTLYANKKSATYAKMQNGISYPKGSRLYQVTWKQQADSLWYGAYIPGDLVTVERIRFNENNQAEYTLFTSRELIRQTVVNDSERIHQILTQPIAVSP